jgi:selenium-binding protein 1
MRLSLRSRRLSAAALVVAAVCLWCSSRAPSRGETCLSPFIKRLDRPETLLYVSCSSLDGKHNDFVGVVDADPASPRYGKMVYQLDLGTHGNEMHHWGYTDDRTRIWACGLFSDKIYIVDVASDPARPRLEKVVDVGAGLSGPHTAYALPGRMLLTFLSGKDGGLPAGLAEFSNDGRFIRRLDLPKDAPYMHDVAIKPELNRMVTSSFTPASNYKIPRARWDFNNFGKELLIWDFKERKVQQTFRIGGAPFEVRWSVKQGNPLGYVICLADNSLWAWEGNSAGEYQVRKLGTTGKLPSDLKQSPDDRFLYVSCTDSDVIQQWDVSDVAKPRLSGSVSPGEHPHMIHISPDGKRLYVTNNLLSTVDRTTNYWVHLIRVGPEGMKLDPSFAIDLRDLPTGPARAHDMLLR